MNNNDKILRIWQKLVRIPKGKREFEDNNEVISKEESKQRIVLLFLICSVFLNITATLLTVIYYNTIPSIIKMVDLNIDNHKGLREYPVQQLVMIYDNGTVMQTYFDNTMKITKFTKILQLPKSEKYFTYSFKEVLHFEFSLSNIPITQYHPNLNQEGHKVIPKSAIDVEEMGYKINEAIQVGNMLWVAGRVEIFIGHVFSENLDLRSSIWFMERQKWIKGPNIKNEFFKDLCLASLNSSAVMFIGGYKRISVSWGQLITPTMPDYLCVFSRSVFSIHYTSASDAVCSEQLGSYSLGNSTWR